jgi:hypothetical protein
MGFDAIPKGGSGKPDGIAQAHLSALAEGQTRRYRVSLEAKSKEGQNKKVAAKTVNVSAIARQRDDFQCDHAVVVGPDFPTSRGENSVLLKEIKADRERTGKTITLVKVTDLARLVRLVPLKRVGLDKLRELFEKSSTPDESKQWIDAVAPSAVGKMPYRRILEVIHKEQQDEPAQVVEYAALVTALRKDAGIKMTKSEVIDICRALARMAPEYVFAHDSSVELTQRPDRIFDAIKAVIGEYPESEQQLVDIGDRGGPEEGSRR